MFKINWKMSIVQNYFIYKNIGTNVTVNAYAHLWVHSFTSFQATEPNWHWFQLNHSTQSPDQIHRGRKGTNIAQNSTGGDGLRPFLGRMTGEGENSLGEAVRYKRSQGEDVETHNSSHRGGQEHKGTVWNHSGRILIMQIKSSGISLKL